jgi:excisionase family DNA binding protein
LRFSAQVSLRSACGTDPPPQRKKLTAEEKTARDWTPDGKGAETMTETNKKKETMDSEAMYTVAEVAKMTRCHYQTIWRHVRDGDLACRRPTRKILISESAIRAWLARGRQ